MVLNPNLSTLIITQQQQQQQQQACSYIHLAQIDRQMTSDNAGTYNTCLLAAFHALKHFQK